jgi:hypothetical protein
MASYAPITLSDIKKNMGEQGGLRKNKYLLEVPLNSVITGYGEKLNVLCQATSLPERSNSSVSIYKTGRKYNIRGETEYQSTYDISLIDDSDMNLRREFDAWLFSVDNSNRNTKPDVNGEGTPFITGYEDEFDFLLSKYQVDVKIWQLDAVGLPVYGYLLQNCFPTSLGAVELGDDQQSQLSEFSVTLTYSEMVPIVFKGDRTQENGIDSNSSIFNNQNTESDSFLESAFPGSSNLNNKIQEFFPNFSLPDFSFPSKPDQILEDFGESIKNKFLKLF